METKKMAASETKEYMEQPAETTIREETYDMEAIQSAGQQGPAVTRDELKGIVKIIKAALKEIQNDTQYFGEFIAKHHITSPTTKEYFVVEDQATKTNIVDASGQEVRLGSQAEAEKVAAILNQNADNREKTDQEAERQESLDGNTREETAGEIYDSGKDTSSDATQNAEIGGCGESKPRRVQEYRNELALRM